MFFFYLSCLKYLEILDSLPPTPRIKELMDLREYLFQKKYTIDQFAQFIGYQRTSIQCVLTGKTKPGRKLVRTIEEKTEGQVTRYDLLKNYPDAIEKL